MSGGAERNEPNTIHNSCADGTAGTFHVDESIDRLMVAAKRPKHGPRLDCEKQCDGLGR